MPTIAPGVDPTMMRAPAAVANSVLPAAPVLPSGAMSTPNTDQRSTDVKPLGQISGRLAAPASKAQASVNDSLAVSMTTVPRRRIGVFLAALLLFDAGLATAGALMMRSALGRATGETAAQPTVRAKPPEGSGSSANPAADVALPSANAPATPATGKRAGATTVATAVDAEVTDVGSGSASSVASPAGALGGAGANVQISPAKTPGAVKDLDKGEAKTADKKATGLIKSEPANAGKRGQAPVDPYATSPVLPAPAPGAVTVPPPVPGPIPVPSGEQTAQEESIADQVRRREVGSRPRFARCYSTAAKASDTPLIGAVTVAFQITGDGRVGNANAVDNSTESLSLARCVVAEVSKWTFAAGGGDAQDFVRVFKFEGQ